MRSSSARRYREFCAQLRRARRDAGMTQAEVATALSVPQSFVSKCESGERRVDIVELDGFARLYGKPLGFFIRPTREP